MTENEIARDILDAAFAVHTKLGRGLFETVYEAALAHELRKRGHRVDVQRELPVVYEGLRIDVGFRMDLLVDDKVVVELKSVEEVAPLHKKQLLTYLRLSDKRLGLLLNFNTAHLKDGITRMVNGLPE